MVSLCLRVSIWLINVSARQEGEALASGAVGSCSAIEAQQAASFPFVNLPLEVRRQVYRKLLLCPHRIAPVRRASTPSEDDYDLFSDLIIGGSRGAAKPVNAKIFPNILATTGGIYEEASVILYGENTFQIKVSELFSLKASYLVHYAEFLHFRSLQEAQSLGFPTSKILRWDILIEPRMLQITSDMKETRLAVFNLCHSLLEMPRLKRLHIYLSSETEKYCLTHQGAGSRSQYCFLKPFVMLRNVEKVSFCVGSGLGCPYLESLQARMQDPRPSTSLVNMYLALWQFVLRSSMRSAESVAMLENAFTAMNMDDLKAFRRARREIIKFEDSGDQAHRLLLYSHDPNDGALR